MDYIWNISLCNSLELTPIKSKPGGSEIGSEICPEALVATILQHFLHRSRKWHREPLKQAPGRVGIRMLGIASSWVEEYREAPNRMRPKYLKYMILYYLKSRFGLGQRPKYMVGAKRPTPQKDWRARARTLDDAWWVGHVQWETPYNFWRQNTRKIDFGAWKINFSWKMVLGD